MHVSQTIWVLFQLVFNVSLAPNSTSNDSYSVFDISLFHHSMHEIAHVNIASVPFISALSMHLISLKLSFINVSIFKSHHTSALSNILDEISFVNVSILPLYFTFPLKFTVFELSLVNLVINFSFQNSLTIICVVSPSSFIDDFFSFWINDYSINFFVFHIFSFVN